MAGLAALKFDMAIFKTAFPGELFARAGLEKSAGTTSRHASRSMAYQPKMRANEKVQ